MHRILLESERNFINFVRSSVSKKQNEKNGRNVLCKVTQYRLPTIVNIGLRNGYFHLLRSDKSLRN